MIGKVRPAILAVGLLIALSAYVARGCADGEVDSAVAEAAEHGDPAKPAAGAAEVVNLDSAALAMADIAIGTADAVAASGLAVTGTIGYDQTRVSHIGPRTEGRIVALRVDLGSRVRGGQVLAVLESPEVGATRADLHEAEALVRIQTENYQREKRLEMQGISSRKELLEAEAELRRAEAAAVSAAERLRVLGASHVEGGEFEGGEFTITAPFAGVVVEKHATLGEVASPTGQLFTLADLSRLWIELDIFERDLARVRTGQPVSVWTAAYPGRAYSGRIVYVADILDPERRTVRARVEVQNPDRSLKPGMFATAEIAVGTGESVVVVPRAAVQDVEGRKVVWVPGETKGEFRAQPVEVGPALADGRVRILAGLAAGDPIVVSGAFTLKAELSKSEFGGHGH